MCCALCRLHTTRRTLEQVGVHPSEKDKLKAFKDADRDRSGQVTWEEFRALGKRLRALGAAAFKPAAHAKSPKLAKKREVAVVRIQAQARGGKARTEARARRRGRGAHHSDAPVAPRGVTLAPAGGAGGHYGQGHGYQGHAQPQGYPPSLGARGYGGLGGHGYSEATAAWPGGSCQPGYAAY